jgi:type IV pilus assembly protein PilO
MQDLDLKSIPQWPVLAQLIIIALIVLLLVIIGYFFDFKPYNQQISTIQQQEEDLKRQFKSLIEKQAHIKAAVDRLPMLKKRLDGWQKNIVSSQYLPNLLDKILNFGKNNNLNIISFKPEHEIKNGIYYEIPVRIDVVGTYDQIARYVSALANMKEFIFIDALFIQDETLNQANFSGQFISIASNDLLTAEIDIKIYRR